MTASGRAPRLVAPDHLLDLAEWEALPEDNSARYELVEGVVVVVPRPRPRHQDIVLRVATQLAAQVPEGWVALPEVELVIDPSVPGGPATVRAPDVVVARAEVLDGRPRCGPVDVLAVVEDLSPGSRRTDRVAKLAEYAEVAIAHYVLVEPEPSRAGATDEPGPAAITEFRLSGSHYALVAEHGPRAALTFGATLEL